MGRASGENLRGGRVAAARIRWIALLAATVPLLLAPPSRAQVEDLPALVLENFESVILGRLPAGWSTSPGSDFVQAGVERIPQDTAPANRALRLEYRIGAEGRSVTLKTRPLELPAAASGLSIDVLGDGSGNTLVLRFRDAAGQELRRREAVTWRGWKQVDLSFSEPGQPAAVRRPRTWIAVDVERTSGAPATGEFAVDEPTAITRFARVETLLTSPRSAQGIPAGWRVASGVSGAEALTVIPTVRAGKAAYAVRLALDWRGRTNGSYAYDSPLPTGSSGAGAWVLELHSGGLGNLLTVEFIDSEGAVWQNSSPIPLDWLGWRAVSLDRSSLRRASGGDGSPRGSVRLSRLIVRAGSSMSRDDLLIGRIYFGSDGDPLAP